MRSRFRPGGLFLVLLLSVAAGTAWATLTILNPSAVTAGRGAFTLTAFCSGCDSTDEVTWNGQILPRCGVAPCYTLVSAAVMTVMVPASFVAAPGVAQVGLRDFNQLPLTINPPPQITTFSPVPAGTLGAAYSTGLAATGGTQPFTWAPTAGSLPAGLSLGQSSGIIAGVPTALGTSTFSVRLNDASNVSASRTFSLTIGGSGSGPSVPSCAITPQNTFLAIHDPQNHAAGRTTYPAHNARVLVTTGSSPAAGTSVTLAATRAIFPDSSGLPALASATAVTDSSGVATFPVNPPSAVASDRTDLTATGRQGADNFQCAGTVVVGAGTLTAVSAGLTPAPAALLKQLREQFGKDYERFSNELVEIVRASPPLEARATAAFLRFDPLLAEVLRGGTVRLRGLEVDELDKVMRAIQKEASPELRRAVFQWRDQLAHLYARVLYDRRTAAQAKWVTSEPLPATAPDSPRDGRLRLPAPLLSFEANQGQAAAGVHFVSRGTAHSAVLSERGLTLTASSQGGIQMRLAGRRRWPQPSGVDRIASRSHYLVGGNPARWRTDVPHYSKVRYPNVYPGTDLIFYGDQGRLRYDFVLAPGARPETIALAFDGVVEFEAQQSGGLVLHHRGGATVLEKPFVYQERDGRRQGIGSRYVSRGANLIGFEIAQYDKNRPLIIDPVLSYSSFAGGNHEDAGLAVAVDSQGSTYVAGLTASANLPGAAPLQPGRPSPGSGNVEAFVTKFTPDGSGVVYTTYFGGNGYDIAAGLAVDAAGNAYVSGSTTSTNFPVVQGVQAAYGGGTMEAGGDGFVLKLNAAGSALLYSTYLGGSGGDVARSIAIDSTGAAYVTGFTASPNFPARTPFQANLRGGTAARSDAFAAKLNPAGTALLYSTFLGGAGDDLGMGISVDATGNAYVTGITYSRDFPTLSALQPALAGSADAFLSKLNPAGSALVYSTYLGGEADDFGLGIALDPTGNAYIAGTTGSSTFPILNAAQPKSGAAGSLGFDGFVTKFAPSGNLLVYSTYLGGGGIDMAQGIAVGGDGAAYVAGETDSTDFPATNPVRPRGALNDAFLAKLSPAGSAIEYASYIGGQGLDSAAAVAVDRLSNAYIAGSSSSRDYPATTGSSQTLLGGRTDAFALKIAAGTTGPLFSVLSAAAFTRGGAVAPDSIATGFGSSLAPRMEVALSSSLPSTLAGVSLSVRDSRGVMRQALLYVVSPGQINFVVPSESATGLSELAVVSGGQTVATGTMRIDNVAPALFAANSNGSGPPAALAIRVDENGNQTPQLVFTCASAGSCVPAPIDVSGADGQVYLSLFGTGVRRRVALTSVRLTIGDLEVPVSFAGPQGQFAGFDQINAGPLPSALAGRGAVNLVLTVDGERANVVTILAR